MPCFHPITARLYRKLDGKQQVSFGAVPAGCDGLPYQMVQLPCGQCIGCRLERSRKWAMRCVAEASMHDENCFITLTYDDAHLPPDGSLQVKDFQDFMKRLRSRVKKPVRFFHCGEYGELSQRPHYHAILFGVDFNDKELLQWKNHKKLSSSSTLPDLLSDVSSSASRCLVSPCLQSLWPFGFSTVGQMTFESAAYVARYCLKKVTGKGADEYYNGRRPEYVTMSRRPGIAAEWFARFGSDVYPADFVWCRGVQCKPPRYFDDLFARQFPDEFAKIKARRQEMAARLPSSEQQLVARETVARQKTGTRSL